VQAVINGERRELDSDVTVGSLVHSLHDAPEGRGLAVAVNGEVVPRTAWERTVLPEGARVEIVAAVQGG
jgi:sulfur carrier protein